MRLISLEMQNFRQYYGKQSIDFNCSDDKNVSIILGENGEGKTGIFRAVVFALFGVVYLTQEEGSGVKSKKDEDIVHLVNLNKMNENIGEPVEACVRLKFKHDGFVYEIKRSKLEMKDDDGEIIDDAPINVEMFITDRDGNIDPNKLTNDDDIQTILGNILDKKLKDFFLFDGEKIESLSKPNQKSREEVKNGVIKLLQIDSITKSIEILDRLEKKQNSRIKKYTTNTKLQAATEELEGVKRDINVLEREIEILDKNIEDCTDEIDEIEGKLSQNKDIQILIDKKNQKKSERTEKRRLLSELKERAKRFLPQNAHNVVLEEFIIKTKFYLGQESIDKNYSTDISIDLIENILKEKVCICGRGFEEGSEAFELLNELKTKYNKSELNTYITIFRSKVRDYLDNKDTVKSDMQDILMKIREIKDEIEEINVEIDNLEERVKEYSQNEENLKYLQGKQDELKKNRKSLENKKLITENKIKELKSLLSKLEERIDELTRGEESLRIESLKLKHIRDLKGNFTKILEDYSLEMREKISEEATRIFKTLISSKDKNIIERIYINENYEIKVKGWDNSSITSDISAGQRQIVSLSFVIALAKVASGSINKMNVPLFMDTPFGRVSGENRDNLIKTIPTLTTQWVLLMTDTEFTRKEEEEFKRADKIGCVYRLKQIREGYTEIQRVEDLTATLSRR